MPPFAPEFSHRWLQSREGRAVAEDVRSPDRGAALAQESAEERAQAQALEELAGRVAAARSVL